MLLRNTPIRQKLIAINLLTSTVVLGLMLVSVFTYEYFRLRNATVRQLSTVGEIIAANSTAALAFSNQNDADEILSALKGKPHISAAALYDKNGKLFSKFPANLAGDSLPGAPQEDGFQYEREFLSVFQPVIENDKRLGTLYLKYDSGAVMREWLSASIGIAGAVMTIPLLVGYLLSRKLQQQISQPILALARTAKAISQQRDFSVRARKFGDDELGLLTDAFNQMLVEIHKLNTTLEQRVAARTAQLGSINLELKREVAERVGAEKALSAALEKERLLLDSAVDVICTIDADGRFVSINPACEQLWGYTQEELIGHQFIELVVPEDVIKTNEAAASIMAGQKATDFENCYQHKDGSLVYVMWSASWSESEQLFFSVARDITQRHLNEAAIFTLASIVESSEDAIISKTLDGTITSWNTGAERLFGYTAEEIIGQHVLKLFPPERCDEENYIRERITRDERIKNFQTVRIRKDGKHIPVSVTVSPVKDKKGNIVGISKIARDITEEKMAEVKLRKSAAELQRSNSELQDFASVASHDLQEPLRKIQSFADELKVSSGNKLDGEEQDTLNRMIAAAVRMRTLINDLLAFSRVTTMAKPFVPVNLALIVKEVQSDLEARLQETKGRIEICDLPTIDADPMQMYQLLQNLIGNGLKFHAPGVNPLITISCENGGPNYRLSVTDNGIGFDEKYIDRIFTVFQRLHGRREYEGTGIGLAICRKIAERHGGQIEVHSAPGAGSTFTVVLPMKQTNEEKQ